MPTATQPISLKPHSGSTYYPREKPIQTPPSLKLEKPPDNLNDIPEPEIEYLKKAGQLKVEEAEYWEKYYDNADENYEWNNGYLEVKPGVLNLHPNAQLFFTLILGSGIQDLSCAALVQDKSCSV
jgi:hypothetical protein